MSVVERLGVVQVGKKVGVGRKHGRDERKEENARVERKRSNFVARAAVHVREALNFACRAASDRFFCDSACMKNVLSNALKLARKGGAELCYFGGDPGSVLNRQLAAEGLLKAAPDGGP